MELDNLLFAWKTAMKRPPQSSHARSLNIMLAWNCYNL